MIITTVLLTGPLLLAGCGGDEDSSPGTAKSGKSGTISISGKDWKGVFYATDKAGRSNLSATITQSGNAITITTNRPAGGIGHRFTGTLGSDGRMRLTDPHDGEIWSTFFGPVTSTYIKLADYERRPTPGNGKDDFFVIELSRKGGTKPANVAATAPNTTTDPVKTPTTPVAPTTPATPKPPTPPTPPTPVGGTPDLPDTPSI
jgi:hypothetical protein